MRGISPDTLRQIAQGAEAVDRGSRDLASEIALLGAEGLLARPWQDTSAEGSGRQESAPQWLFDLLFQLGQVSLPVARLYEGHVDALGLIERLGTAAARRRAGELAAEGQLLAVWGADAPDDPVTARADSDGGLTLAGTKGFASGMGLVRAAVVSVRMEGACHLVLVPADDAERQDADAWDMDAMVGSRSGRFSLDGLRVPPDMRLGGADAYFQEPWFHGGLWRLCAVHAGALEAIARELGAMLAARNQLDAPLQRTRLAELAILSRTARLWALAASDSVAASAEPGAELMALLGREAIEQSATQALSHIERAAGTALHHRSHSLGRMVRDLRLYLRQGALDAKLSTALDLWLKAEDAQMRAAADRNHLPIAGSERNGALTRRLPRSEHIVHRRRTMSAS